MVEQVWRTISLPMAQNTPQLLEIADESGQVDWRTTLTKTSDLIQKTITFPPDLVLDDYRRPSLKILMAGSAVQSNGAGHSYDLVIKVDGVEVKRYSGGPPEDADWRKVPIGESLLQGKKQIVVALDVVGKPDAEWNYVNIYGNSGATTLHSSYNGSSADLSLDDGVQAGEYLIRLDLESRPFGKNGIAFPSIPLLLVFSLVLYAFARSFWQSGAASLLAFSGFLVALGIRYLLGLPDFIPFLAAAVLIVMWSITNVTRRTGLAWLNRFILSALALVLCFGFSLRWAELIDVLGTPLLPDSITYRALADTGGWFSNINSGPLFALVVKVAFSFLGSSDLALRLTSITSSMFLIAAAFWFARRFVNAYFGLLIAVIFSFNHEAIVSSVQGLPRELFGIILILFLASILTSQGEAKKTHTVGLTGDNIQISRSAAVRCTTLAVACFLIYPYSLIFILPACVYALWRGKLEASPALMALAVLVIVVASIMLSELQGLAAQTPFVASDPGNDSITLYEKRFASLRSALPDTGVVGYVTDEEPGSAQTRGFYLTQYTLSPVVVDGNTQHPLVVGNFHDKAAALSIYKNLTLLRDFGGGVMLFRGESK